MLHRFQINADVDHLEIERECYDMEELLSDLGGMAAIILGVFKVVTDYFADIRTNAIFAEMAYQGEMKPEENRPCCCFIQKK